MLRRLFDRSLPLSGVGANETTGISIYDWKKMFAPGAQVGFGGNMYQAYQMGAGSGGSGYYQSNPVVFTCAAVRTLLFSEARFQWQQMRGGRPGDLFGNPDLALLEEPWAGHTTRDLLAQAELDIFSAGNSYWVRNGAYLQRLDPAHVGIVTASVFDQQLTGYQIGEQLSYYLYKPDNDPRHWTQFLPEDVCHYKPYPSVSNRFIGQSWITPCLTDVATDDAINTHKQATITNGANLSTIVSFDPSVSPEQFNGFVSQFRQQHEGPANAQKTLFLSGGADVKTVGQTFENLMLQATQGGGETRIAAAAGVPAPIVGFSEGLKGSSLNAGNYAMARRRFADGTMRPLWGCFASSMQSLLNKPAGSRLWYDTRDIAFLREDSSDEAAIMESNAATLQKLVQSGWEPDAAVDAVLSGDIRRLVGAHTGLTSVQLVPPDTNPPSAPSTPPVLPAGKKNSNGKVPVTVE